MASDESESERVPGMPVEILTEILDHVDDAGTLFACAQVNSTFKTLTVPRLWRGHLTDADMGPSVKQLMMMQRRLGQSWLQEHLPLIEFMHLTVSLKTGGYWADALAANPAFVSAKPKAVSIVMDDKNVAVNTALLKQLLGPSLYSLSLETRYVGGRGLSIQRFRMIQLASRLERLVLKVNLDIPGEEFLNFLKATPSIKRLSFSCAQRHDRALPAWQNVMPHLLRRAGLKELETSLCAAVPNIDENMVQAVLRTSAVFPALEILSLDRLTSIGWQHAGPHASNLKHIYLEGHESLSLREHLLALSDCENLEELYFSYSATWPVPIDPPRRRGSGPWLENLAKGCTKLRRLSLLMPAEEISVIRLILLIRQWRQLEVFESSCQLDIIISMQTLSLLFAENKRLHTFKMYRARATLRELFQEDSHDLPIDSLAELTLDMDHFHDFVPEVYPLEPARKYAQGFITAIKANFPRMHHFTNLANIYDSWEDLPSETQYGHYVPRFDLGPFLKALQKEYRERGCELRDDVVFRPALSIVELMDEEDSERWRRTH